MRKEILILILSIFLLFVFILIFSRKKENYTDDSCPSGYEWKDGKCVCVSICKTAGRECGSDGCGGSCGTCDEGYVCNIAGRCQKDCKDGVCGGICGDCIAPEKCIDGVCKCETNCDGKTCGEDGCGGFCECSEGEKCGTKGNCCKPYPYCDNDLGCPCKDGDICYNNSCCTPKNGGNCSGKYYGELGCGLGTCECPDGYVGKDNKCVCKQSCDDIECGMNDCFEECNNSCLPGLYCSSNECRYPGGCPYNGSTLSAPESIDEGEYKIQWKAPSDPDKLYDNLMLPNIPTSSSVSCAFIATSAFNPDNPGWEYKDNLLSTGDLALQADNPTGISRCGNFDKSCSASAGNPFFGKVDQNFPDHWILGKNGTIYSIESRMYIVPYTCEGDPTKQCDPVFFPESPGCPCVGSMITNHDPLEMICGLYYTDNETLASHWQFTKIS